MIECIKTMAKIEIKLKKNDTELSNVTINKNEFENKENMSERTDVRKMRTYHFIYTVISLYKRNLYFLTVRRLK